MNQKDLQAQYKLLHQDALHNVEHRFAFLKTLTATLNTAKNTSSNFAIAYLDFDFFTVYNNFTADEFNNYVLKHVLKYLKKFIKDETKITRLTNNAFIILITQPSHLSNIEKLIKRLMKITLKAVVFQKNEIYLNLIAGVSQYPNDGESIEILLKNAELACKHCKRKGSNNYQIYHSKINEPVIRNINLEAELHKALEQNQLELYYQPVISVENQSIVGAEALIRWNNPQLGLIAPNQFIPLAEVTGLIVPIGEWVMHTACKQIVKWHESGFVDLKLAINLSARQFNDPDFLKKVVANLNQTNVPHDALILEITESILMNDLEANIVLLQALSDLDILLASDDFGVGYSSLNYLRLLPFDILKIDRSFIQSMETIHQKEAVVSTIIALGKDLNLKVIAEGVETQAQFEILKKQGCDFTQGYLFSRPVQVNAFEALLTTPYSKLQETISKDNYFP